MNNEPQFEAVLSPHRSLGRLGFVLLMSITTVITAVHMVIFARVGAWPVFAFFGLDLALLFGAFWLSYRSGRMREFIRMSRTGLSIRKVFPSGRSVDHQFNPFWTRFSIDRHEEIGITDMRVSSRGQQTEVGSFLNPEDKESFATAFQRALAAIKKR